MTPSDPRQIARSNGHYACVSFEQVCPRCGRGFAGDDKHALADAVVEHARSSTDTRSTAMSFSRTLKACILMNARHRPARFRGSEPTGQTVAVRLHRSVAVAVVVVAMTFGVTACG